jgi:hypothetical protein
VELVVTLVLAAAAFAGLVTFLVLRGDLGTGRAVAASAGAGLAVGVAFLFILYLAIVAFLVAIVAYLVVRRLLSNPRFALMTATATYTAVALASGAAFWVALDSM